MHLGPQVETSLSLQFQHMTLEEEAIILANNRPLTQAELEHLLAQPYHKPLPPTPSTAHKQKKQLRMGFQSRELRLKFDEVLKQAPGRQKEAKQILDFLMVSENGNSTPLCLHGNTGCGKTSLVQKVMSFFQDNFQTVKVANVNCMNMWSSNHVYKEILSIFYSVTQKRKSAADVLFQHLQASHNRKHEPTKIIVLDQIDQFLKQPNFLYNMLQSLAMGAKLVLILISNVFDFTLKLNQKPNGKLESKLLSRMKFNKIIFNPYSFSQIQQIFKHKYKNIVFMILPSAITYISKKIASINSDIRLLIKIYTRLETQFNRNGGKKILDMKAVNSIVYDDNKLPVMLAPYSAVLKILYKASISKATLPKQIKKQDISQQIKHTLYIQGNQFPSRNDILLILSELRDCGLITLCNSIKNCDITFEDYGIKVHESLHLLYDDKDNS